MLKYNERRMYQGNLVEVLALNGCLAKVTVVDEPETRAFFVGLDDLVEIETWKKWVKQGLVEPNPAVA